MNANKRTALSVIEVVSRLLAEVINNLPLVLAALVMISPVGPHLYLGGEYRQAFGNRYYVSCTYVGSRGFIEADNRLFMDDCPLIAWIDTREFQP